MLACGAVGCSRGVLARPLVVRWPARRLSSAFSVLTCCDDPKMSYVQQQHSFKYAAFGGSPDSGAAAGSPLHLPPSSGLLLDPMPQSNGASPMPALGGGVGLSPSARLDDALAQLRNLGGSSSSSSATYSQRSTSLRTAPPVGGVRLVGVGSYSAATAAAAANNGGDGDLSSNDGSSTSGGNSLPRHRPAVPYTLVAGMPPSKLRDAGVSWSDGEGRRRHGDGVFCVLSRFTICSWRWFGEKCQ